MLEFNFYPFPVLTTNRLILRELTYNDANEIYSYRSDTAIMKYIHRPLMLHIDEAIPFIDKVNSGHLTNASITWALTYKGNDKLIGTIGFWRIEKEHHRAEIGYLLGTAYQRQGVMQEAMQTILKYGFEVMKLHSVEAHVNPKNTGSVNVLEKSGLKREAFFRQNFRFNDVFSDTYVYCMLSSDYFAKIH